MIKQNAFGILFFIAAVAILGFVFYNYTETGKLNYTSIVIAIIGIIIASLMQRKK